MPAHAATVTWEGDEDNNFWNNGNWSAVPNWGGDIGSITGAGLAPVVSASGSVFGVSFGTVDGQTLSSSDSSYVLSLTRNSANGSAVASTVSAGVSVNLATGTGSNAVVIAAGGTSKVLTVSGDITTPMGKWMVSGTSSGSKVVLSGTNAFANTLYLGNYATLETASDHALDFTAPAAIMQFGTIGTTKPTTATLRLNNSFTLSQVNAQMEGYQNGAVDFYIEAVGASALTLGNLSLIQGNWGAAVYTAHMHKTGDGTLTLVGTSGASSAKDGALVGSVEVDGGTFLANNASGSPLHSSVAVNVNSGGTFGGTGGVSGLVTVLSGGHIAPGASIESLGVGSLDLESSSFLDFEFNNSPANDLIVLDAGGVLTINGGGVNLYEEGTSNPWTGAGSYNLIQYTGASLVGSVSNLSVANPQAGMSYQFLANGDYVQVVVTPEPATMSLFGLGSLGIAVLRMRRRRS